MSETDHKGADAGISSDSESIARRRQGRTEAPLGKRLRILLVVSIVLVAGLSALALLSPSSDAAVLCVILPEEEAPFSHTAEIESAVTMAKEELNEWGGIGNMKIELMMEETEVEYDDVSSLFERLEREVRPIAYMSISCELLSMLAPLTEEAEVPLIGLASAPGLTQGYEWTYRYYTSSEHEVNSTLRILETLDVSSLGILYSVSPHGCGLNDLLVERFVAVGGTVESQACEAEETDFTDEVEALSDNDAIFVVAHCGTLVTMFATLDESGYDGYVVASSCASSPTLRSVMALDSLYVSAPILYKAENILASEFTEKFTANFEIPFSHHAAVSYDIVYLVHDLLEIEGRDPTRAVLGQRLADGFVLSGVMGSMRIDPGSHDFPIPVYPAVILEGELSYL
ncbi:MAG: ABC transporter substrate-binding protein [Methanobacteriota archaeon]|nr:MAG: ABC transporter substrate-binding protein [Euryarchaeota archaeon]